MTKDKLQALGERAQACAAWKWLPRMRYLGVWPRSGTVLEAGSDYLVVYGDLDTRNGGGYHEHAIAGNDFVPDLSDVASVGCLLALVRKAWGDRYCYAEPTGIEDKPSAYFVYVNVGRPAMQAFRGDTEAEALVAALEAAP